MQQHTMDKIFCGTMVAFAVGCGAVAWGYPFDSSYFPRILSVFIAFIGLYFGVRLHKGNNDRGNNDKLWDERRGQARAALGVFGASAAYIFALQIINFEFSTLLFISLFSFCLGCRHLVTILVVSLLSTALLYGIFFEFLAVSRPESLFFEQVGVL